MRTLDDDEDLRTRLETTGLLMLKLEICGPKFWTQESDRHSEQMHGSAQIQLCHSSVELIEARNAREISRIHFKIVGSPSILAQLGFRVDISDIHRERMYSGGNTFFALRACSRRRSIHLCGKIREGGHSRTRVFNGIPS